MGRGGNVPARSGTAAGRMPNAASRAHGTRLGGAAAARRWRQSRAGAQCVPRAAMGNVRGRERRAPRNQAPPPPRRSARLRRLRWQQHLRRWRLLAAAQACHVSVRAQRPTRFVSECVAVTQRCSPALLQPTRRVATSAPSPMERISRTWCTAWAQPPARLGASSWLLAPRPRPAGAR